MVNDILAYIKTWEKRCYQMGIPDEVPNEIKHLAPNYKMIAIAILNNDHCLKSLGFTPKESKYYGILKRIELRKRGVITQLSLF